MKSQGLYSLEQSSQLPFLLQKGALLSFLNWVLCWSWINPSVLEKYLAVYSIQTKKTDKVLKLLFQEMKPSIIYLSSTYYAPKAPVIILIFFVFSFQNFMKIFFTDFFFTHLFLIHPLIHLSFNAFHSKGLSFWFLIFLII